MIIDIVKYLARDCIIYKNSCHNKDFLTLLESVYDDYKTFYKLYYNYDKTMIKELNKRKACLYGQTTCGNIKLQTI